MANQPRGMHIAHLRPSALEEDGSVLWRTKTPVKHKDGNVLLGSEESHIFTMDPQEAFDTGRALIEASGFDPSTYYWK